MLSSPVQKLFHTRFPVLTPDEAAEFIQHGQTVGFSGFTPAGATKVIPKAIARRAKAEHDAGRPFQIGVVTGASTGPSLDGELARANAISWRTPYQSDPDLRKRINTGETRFFDMHLSMLPQNVRYGFLGKFSWAVIEAASVSDDGVIVPTASVGASPTFCGVADKILIELNHYHPPMLYGIHDIYEPEDPPHRRAIPIYKPSDRAGPPYIKVDPSKIAGIVETNLPDETADRDHHAHRPERRRVPRGGAEEGHDSRRLPPDPVRRGRHRQRRPRRPRRAPGHPVVRDVHRGHPGLGHQPDQQRQGQVRQRHGAHGQPDRAR